MTIRFPHISLLVLLLSGCSSAAPQPKTPRPGRARPDAALRLKWLRSLPQTASPVVNSVIVSANLGDSGPLPVTVSRFFAFGEIPACPVATLGGETLPTQADVKTRWPDGSTQHAIVSFQLPGTAPQAAEILFAGQECPASPVPLTAQQMLGDDFDFGAEIRIQSGSVSQAADARAMLEAGHFHYWLQGPIVTQVIIEETSAEPAFNLGFDEHKSFRPMFVATFFPGHRGVKIEAIGEITGFNRMQDLSYDLSIRTGRPLAEQPDFNLPGFKHLAAARWRKSFWSGQPLAAVHIDHNLPYLVFSRALPNFDLSRKPSAGALRWEADQFAKSDRGEPGGAGQYQRAFPTTGGRGDLGVFTRWDVRYLYSFTPEMETVFLGNANATGHAPIHYRESAPDLTFTSVGEPKSALGRVLSVDARPSYCLGENQRRPSDQDRIKPVGPYTYPTWGAPWIIDTAHQPSMAYLPYLLTGDYYFLEELYFWSAWNIGQSTTGCGVGGPDVTKLGFMYAYTNGRAYGWTFRNIAHAALMAPDGSPEKDYFTDKLLNNIAVFEGIYDIQDGLTAQSPDRQPAWDYGKRSFRSFNGPNPIALNRPPDMKAIPTNEWGIDPTECNAWMNIWFFNIVNTNVGLIEELGFPAGPLRRTMLSNLHGQLTHPAYNHFLIDHFVMPVGRGDGVLQSWEQVMAAFTPEWRNKLKFTSFTGDFDFGYLYLARSAASFLTDIEVEGRSGLDAWRWINDNAPSLAGFDDNPKWSLVPRFQDVPGSVASPESWSKSLRRWAKPGFSAAARSKSKR